jgi:hypothetical protein
MTQQSGAAIFPAWQSGQRKTNRLARRLARPLLGWAFWVLRFGWHITDAIA